MPSPHPPACRILVAHEEPIAAAGLLAALRPEPGFEVIDASSHDVDILEACHVVVADHRTAMAMLDQSALHVLPWYLAAAKVIVLSSMLQPAQIRTAIRGGATGYLRLGCSLDELTLSVRTVAVGSRYLCGAVSRQMADSLLNAALTSREHDVMRHLVRGHCNKAIARELDIATGTVKTHMRTIMGKLNAKTRNEAASIARSNGLVDEWNSTRDAGHAVRWPTIFRGGNGAGSRFRDHSSGTQRPTC